MKRLVKLLFPKTYQAIYDDGYIQAYNVYNNHYDDYDDDYQQYHQYVEHELEMQRLHDEHYAELAAEYEKECIKTREFLAEMYNPKPVGVPLLEVGDKIHLYSKEGMYTVAKVYNDSFAYCTKYSELSYANYSDYKCHAGGRWNNKGE